MGNKGCKKYKAIKHDQQDLRQKAKMFTSQFRLVTLWAEERCTQRNVESGLWNCPLDHLTIRPLGRESNLCVNMLLVLVRTDGLTQMPRNDTCETKVWKRGTVLWRYLSHYWKIFSAAVIYWTNILTDNCMKFSPDLYSFWISSSSFQICLSNLVILACRFFSSLFIWFNCLLYFSGLSDCSSCSDRSRSFSSIFFSAASFKNMAEGNGKML